MARRRSEAPLDPGKLLVRRLLRLEERCVVVLRLRLEANEQLFDFNGHRALREFGTLPAYLSPPAMANSHEGNSRRLLALCLPLLGGAAYRTVRNSLN